MSAYQGPERRNVPVRFELAIQEASEHAAQKIARIHRRRLVTQCFLAALATASAVAIVAVLVTNHQNRVYAQKSAVYNCQIFKQAANAMSDFVASDAKLREQTDLQPHGRNRLVTEVLADFAKIINPVTLKKVLAKQRAAEQSTVTNWGKDAQLLKSLGGTDCVAHLSG